MEFQTRIGRGITQLVGLALGLEPKKLGFSKHIVDPMPLLSSLSS